MRLKAGFDPGSMPLLNIHAATVVKSHHVKITTKHENMAIFIALLLASSLPLSPVFI